MRHATILAVGVLLVLGATAREAAACSCMQSGPACQAFWKTEAVFDATVEGIEMATGPQESLGDRTVAFPEKLVRMSVRQGFKGVTASGPLDVFTAEQGASCGYDFKPGHRYLVFASKRPADGRWVVSLCSATQKYDGTGDSAAFLASLTAPAAGGRVFGTVKSFERRFDPVKDPEERRHVARIRLLGGGQERAATSANGSFEFTGLEPGPYRLEIDLPPGYSTYATSRKTQIPNARACAEETFSLAPAGRVTGLVLTGDGKPAANVQIELTRPDAQPHPDIGYLTIETRTKNDGSFELAGVPPGAYIVGINLNDLPSKYNPYARTVYPSDGTGDAIVRIGAGDAYDLGTWQLPSPPRVINMPGAAVWEDGTAAAGVYVGAWDVTGKPVARARGAGGASTAQDGSFTLELREGRTYTFTARDKSNRLLSVTGPRVTVGAAAPAPIHLTLTAREP